MEFAPNRLKNSETEIAYLAGLIDGEGYIHIAKVKLKDRINPEYYVKVNITNTNYTIMEYLNDMFGGHIQGPYTNNINSRPHWRWVIQYSNAENIIEAILPYLVIKREEAETALELRYTKGRSTYPVPHKVLDEREHIFQLLKELKHG